MMSTMTSLSTVVPAGTWSVDPAHSKVGFAVKHMGIATVRGEFTEFEGTLEVGEDLSTARAYGIVKTQSVDTNEPQRDEHLRSADFFDAGRHPQVVVTVTARPAGPAALACQGSLEAAGHAEPVEFTAHVADASAETVVLRADLAVDRTRFAMTWSPLGMASAIARATVVARFVRP